MLLMSDLCFSLSLSHKLIFSCVVGLKCSQAQKRSKDIDKTVHVASEVQPQFDEATRILFVCKKKLKYFFNNSSPSHKLSCVS